MEMHQASSRLRLVKKKKNELTELIDSFDRSLKHSVGEQRKRLAKKQRFLKKKLKSMEKEIARLENSNGVSDHAIVKYVERILGINVNLIRDRLSELIPDDYDEHLVSFDSEFCAVINNKVVITVRPKGKPNNKKQSD